MKKITVAVALISLLSFGAYAQTKPKTAPKPANEKPAIKAVVKPVTKPISKPVAKPVAKSADKSATKPAIKSNAAPSAKFVKSSEKPPVKSAPKPFVKSVEPAKTGQPVKSSIYKGEVAGKTYTSRVYNFEITLPENWEIPGDDFEKSVREKGVNLNLETPKAVDPKIQTKLNQMTNNVSVLLNAFKYTAGTNANAFLRVSIEDLQSLPQVRDAVDYFDLMRETYKNVRLPADFKYSETQAERLGRWQFGFLDTSSKTGKKRMYATVRNGYALMFTLTYKSEEDLQALRKVLADGNFRLK